MVLPDIETYYISTPVAPISHTFLDNVSVCNT